MLQADFVLASSCEALNKLRQSREQDCGGEQPWYQCWVTPSSFHPSEMGEWGWLGRGEGGTGHRDPATPEGQGNSHMCLPALTDLGHPKIINGGTAARGGQWKR